MSVFSTMPPRKLRRPSPFSDCSFISGKKYGHGFRVVSGGECILRRPSPLMQEASHTLQRGVIGDVAGGSDHAAL